MASSQEIEKRARELGYSMWPGATHEERMEWTDRYWTTWIDRATRELKAEAAKENQNVGS